MSASSFQRQGWRTGMEQLHERFAKDPATVKVEALAAMAVPDWLKTEMELPPEFLRQLQKEPLPWLRARPGTGGALAAALGDCETTPAAPDALHYLGAKDLFLTAQFHNGAFEIQDLASQMVGYAALSQARGSRLVGCLRR